MTKKCRKRLYHLTQLKRANIGLKELLQFYKPYKTCSLEYACPVFHNSLTSYLSNDLESVQKRALKIILPHYNYENALKFTNLVTCNVLVKGGRNDLTTKLFQKIVADPSRRLHGHLPPRLEHLNMELRTQHLFNINFNTKYFRNSFITYNSLKMYYLLKFFYLFLNHTFVILNVFQLYAWLLLLRNKSSIDLSI